MKVLFIGDIVGNSGKKAIETFLPNIKKQYRPQLTIANAENIASGRGITERDYKFLMSHGIDVITLGNHAFDNNNIYSFIADAKCLVRPYNSLVSKAGKGIHYIKINQDEIAVINLLGSVFMDECNNVFALIDSVIDEVSRRVQYIIIDFHAEATSEKIALANYLDGRVSAVIGTHTHVQTNDARILPGGTAYISDAGMTGSMNSVLGFNKDDSIKRFCTGEKIKLRTAENNQIQIGAVLLELYNEIGRGNRIKIVKV